MSEIAWSWMTLGHVLRTLPEHIYGYPVISMDQLKRLGKGRERNSARRIMGVSATGEVGWKEHYG
jgi:hypothetical protein